MLTFSIRIQVISQSMNSKLLLIMTYYLVTDFFKVFLIGTFASEVLEIYVFLVD